MWKVAKGYKLPVIRWVSSEYVIYTVMAIVNCIVYFKVAKRDLKSSYYTGTHIQVVTMWGTGSVKQL